MRLGGRHSYRGWNYCCQGGVAELVKRAIVLIGDELLKVCDLKSRVALDQHDALVLEVVHAEWDTAIRIAMRVMS